MKKILTIIIALTLVLVMTGCGSKSEYQVCVDNGGTVITNSVHTGKQCFEQEGYTQDEVRDLIDSLIESSEYKIYVDMDFEIEKLYDKEEVDALLDTLIELTRYTWAVDDNGIYLVDDTVNDLNERVYDIESDLRDFERFEYEDLLDLLEYMENDDLFASELDNYLNEKYQTQIDELEERIEILEGE